MSRLGARIDWISGYFLGRPYAENALDSLPGRAETLTASLDSFDCVTYMEVVLALSISKSVQGFLDALRRIRYKDGQVHWSSRNHYMLDWARNNEASGFISDITEASGAIERTRTLNVVKGLPARETSFKCIPKRRLAAAEKNIETGDFILFASTRKNLDVFHTGVLIKDNVEVLLRHATRSKWKVVEERLADFLDANRMSGIILLRPIEQ